MLPPQQAPRELVLQGETVVTAGVTVATAEAATAEAVPLAVATAQPSNHLTRISKVADSSEPAAFLSFPTCSGISLCVSGCNTGRLLLRSPVRVNAP